MTAVFIRVCPKLSWEISDCYHHHTMPFIWANITNTIMVVLCSCFYNHSYCPKQCWSLAGWRLVSAGRAAKGSGMCSSDEKQLLNSFNHTRQGFPCQGVFLRTTVHAPTNIGTHVKETSSHSFSFSYLGAGLAKDGRKEGGGEVSLFP